MGLRPALLCAAAVVALALTGCSAAGDDGAGAAPAAAATATPTTKSGGADVAAAPVSAEALCAHLKKEAPRIEAVGSEVGAEAQLTMSIASLYDDHLDQLNGSVIDAQAVQSCPDIRAKLLKAAGLKSFAEL
jgi:hypothetical protein